MLARFAKALAIGGIATITYASTAITTPAPAAAQFGRGYVPDDDDDHFGYRPARRGIEIEDDFDEPRVKHRTVEKHIVRPVVERRVVEREVIQPVVKRTVIHRVVQPVVEHRVVYRPPIVRKVVVHRPVVRRTHYVHRPWHHRRHCFLPERHLCG